MIDMNLTVISFSEFCMSDDCTNSTRVLLFKILAHKLGVWKFDKNFESRDDHQFKFFIFENEKNFVLDKTKNNITVYKKS